MFKRDSAFAFVVLAIFSISVRGDTDPALNDATLNDVYFVDAHFGWAVGDRGVIWHTEDGGRSWQLQTSGTVCTLRSVWFVGRKMGWAVGGQGIPYSSGSRGLVLATWDGGQTWQALSWDQFPRFHGVQFVNAKDGHAWGESSEFYPAGLFGSENSGRLWHPAAGGSSPGFMGGWFLAPDAGVLTGLAGSISLVQDRAVRPVSMGSLGNRTIRSVQFNNDGSVWAVADGGLILRSSSRGASWSVVPTGLPDPSQAIFDWRGVHTIADSVWVVGRPGAIVLHSPDAGRKWLPQPTGQGLPLEAVWFHDRQRGWAVGSLGTILATQDGGQNWQVQRRGGERAALLAVHGLAVSVPLLAHVQLGAEQGYLSVDLSVVSNAQNWDDSARSTAESRLADAVCIAGGSRSELEWRFPVNPLALSLSHALDEWNRQSDGQALKDLERRLVLAIRMWRPEAIVCDSPDPNEAPDSTCALVSQALERAFQSAADATEFPELIDLARLEPWSAKKLLAATRSAEAAEIRISASELSRRPGTSGKPLDDQASLATSLVAETYRPSDEELKYRLVASRLPAGKSDNSLMAGIVLEPGGIARRKLLPPEEITDAQRRSVQMRRNLWAILNRADGQPVLARQLNAQLGSALKDLSPEQAGNMLFALARTHFSQGRWSETRELLEKLLRDFPEHLTSAEAQRWLVQFYASSEARHRERLSGVVHQSMAEPVAARSQVGEPSKGSKPAAQQSSANGPTSARMSSSRTGGAVGGQGSDVAWATGAAEFAKRLMQSSPLSWSDPALQFPLAAAQRTLGNVKDAEKFYTTFSLSREFGPWADAARSERWMRDRQGAPPKPVVLSIKTPSPPHLDGVLDDAVWRTSMPIALQNLQRVDGDDWQTRAWVAHDQRFLYFAISCYSNSGESPAALRPRSRDMDLSAQDQVHLTIDLDRDYTTYYHLAVDRRGCVFDACWGDRTWDPNWYVASQSDKHGYRIEAAIPISELTDTMPMNDTVWAFNAVRVVPGQRVMAWSRPAGLAPRPEGMGYLLFRDGPMVPPRAAVAN